MTTFQTSYVHRPKPYHRNFTEDPKKAVFLSGFNIKVTGNWIDYREECYQAIKKCSVYIRKFDLPTYSKSAYLHLKTEEQAAMLLEKKVIHIRDEEILIYPYDTSKRVNFSPRSISARQSGRSTPTTNLNNNDNWSSNSNNDTETTDSTNESDSLKGLSKTKSLSNSSNVSNISKTNSNSSNTSAYASQVECNNVFDKLDCCDDFDSKMKDSIDYQTSHQQKGYMDNTNICNDLNNHLLNFRRQNCNNSSTSLTNLTNQLLSLVSSEPKPKLNRRKQRDVNNQTIDQIIACLDLPNFTTLFGCLDSIVYNAVKDDVISMYRDNIELLLIKHTITNQIVLLYATLIARNVGDINVGF